MSNNNVRPIMGKGVVVHQQDGNGAIVDHWGQIVGIAKPTLDCIPKLHESRDWLTKWKTHDPHLNRLTLDEERVRGSDLEEAKSRLAIIPDVASLQATEKLFDNAACKAEPEPFYHLALGAMLKRMPNAANVAPADYAFGIVDTILHDPESGERDCEAGFSAPVFVSALRKVLRESKFVPSSAEVLEACQLYRKKFHDLRYDVTMLIEARESAERVIAMPRKPWLQDDDEDQDIPF
jgi:hypothetical protein